MAAKSTPKSTAEKLAERDADGTRTGANAPKPKASADKPKAPKSKPGPSRETLIKAAKLRDDGATWDAIRSATGCRLGSSGWFRAWEREGIEHIPAGQRVKPKAEQPAAAKPAKKAPAPAPKTSGAAMKPDADARKRPRVQARRSGKGDGPRTSNGKAAPVRTRKATAAELAVAA